MSNLLIITSGTSRTELIIVSWEFHLPVFLFKISVAYILTYLEKFADITMTIFNWFSLSSLLGTCVYKPCTSLEKFILQSNSNILKYCRRQRKKECKNFICGHDALKFLVMNPFVTNVNHSLNMCMTHSSIDRTPAIYFE